MLLNDPTILTFFIVTNLIALGMTVLAWKAPRWGRLLFSINFLGAAVFNGIFLYIDPEEYAYYSEFVWLESYRAFILGPFLDNILLILGLIVAYQLYVGIGLLSGGWRLKSAAVLGAGFLIVIAPFGLGAAFPATLIQAAGFILILRAARQDDSPIRLRLGKRPFSP